MSTACRTLLLSLLLPMSGFASDAPETSTPPAAPSWQSLKYLQQALWVEAVSEILLEPCPQPGTEAHWCLIASNSVAENREEIRLETKTDGALVSRQRESVGRKQSRLKSWRYEKDGILRLRQVPAKTGVTGDYETTSERRLGYPPDAGPVTDPLLLLMLAAPGPSGQPAHPRFTVQTDLNFFEVTLTPAGQAKLNLDYQLDGEHVKAAHRVSLVRIEARQLEPRLDTYDFSLLGLSGGITIAFDTLSGLPVQLRGAAPRLGNTEINLVSATLRHPAR